MKSKFLDAVPEIRVSGLVCAIKTSQNRIG